MLEKSCGCRTLRLGVEHRPVQHELQGAMIRVTDVPGYPCICGKNFHITDQTAEGVRRAAWGAYKNGLTKAAFRS